MKFSIRNLSKTYANGVKALRDVELTLEKGIFGLLGPNGAGKSTLMRTIATLQEPDTGSIVFDGLDILKNKHGFRKMLGYLPQDFGVYPKISGEMMLDHIAHIKGISDAIERRKIVSALLERVNLTKDKDRSMDTYSGGMKQRFGIAQALIGDPKVIVVDEPTAGLDPAERIRFYDLLSEIGDNAIVILSTHIVEDIKSLCSQFAIFLDGSIVYAGTTGGALRKLQGRIYSRSIPKSEFPRYKEQYSIISSRIREGKLVVTVLSDRALGSDFLPTTPSLEDFYLYTVTEGAKRDQYV